MSAYKFNYNPNFLRLRTFEMDEVLVTPSLLKKARSLTLPPPSGMNAALDYFQVLSRVSSVDALGIFAYYLDEIIGWALFSFEEDTWGFVPLKEGESCTHVYVDVNYRHQGVGTALMHLAARIAQPDTMRIYGYTPYNSFFKQLMTTFPHIEGV
jgi:GNAT superfamily N-acetyltransferase